MSEGDSLYARKRIKITAIVHVIEARHLVGKDSNGLSDPFVRVTVAGKRQATEIRRNAINATWDQTFTFQDLDLSVEEYEAELIVLQVFDANIIMRNELIGQFSFGLAKVRNQPLPHRHQVYRRWLVLTDPRDPLEEQGFLQVTVTVLGPGDVPPAHSRQEDYAVATTRSNNQQEERILRNPDVRRRGYNFSVKVFRGEDLAVTDTWNKTSDPFVVVRFNGLMARTPHQAHTTTPNWNHLLVLPVFTPCFSNTIEIQLYDYVRGQPDRLLATRRLNFTSLLGQSFPPSWFNFYGRMDEESDSSGWVCDVVRSLKPDQDVTNYMGRVLMSINTELTDHPIHIDKPCLPIKGPKEHPYVLYVDIYRIAELDLSFGRKVMVELQFGPLKRQSDWCSFDRSPQRRDVLDQDVFAEHGKSIKLSCSGEQAHDKDDIQRRKTTMAQTNARKLVSSDPCQFRTIEVSLPSRGQEPTEQECSQFYDLVINIYVKGVIGSPQRVGFLRFKAVDIMGYEGIPEWFPVRGLANGAGASETPAQILASIRFGTKLNMPLRQASGPSIKNGGHYQLRAHVYQARDLRAADAQGLANPFVKISLGGKTARLASTSRENKLNQVCETNRRMQAQLAATATPQNPNQAPEAASDSLRRSSVVRDSLNPLWYETLVIDDVVLPNQLSLAPDVDIRVFSMVKGGSDIPIGRVKFPSSLCSLDLWPITKRPRWLKLARSDLSVLRGRSAVKKPDSVLQLTQENHGENEFEAENLAGDILIKLELIPMRKLKSYPIWAHRWPRVVPCVLHLGTVGLRRLEEFGLFGSIDKPFCEISVQSVPNMLAVNVVATKTAEEHTPGGRLGMHGDYSRNSVSMNKIREQSTKNRPGRRQDPAPTESHRNHPLSEPDSMSDPANTDELLAALVANIKNYAFDELPLRPGNGLEPTTGALQGKWLDRARQVDRYMEELLLYLRPNSVASSQHLFHPASCKQGIASWRNRRREDISMISKLLGQDSDDEPGAAGAAMAAEYHSRGDQYRNNNYQNDSMELRHEARGNQGGNSDNDSNNDNNSNGGDLEAGDDAGFFGSRGEGDDSKDDEDADEEISVIKERQRRTFFDTVSLLVNMPIDPFYAPSMTIKVFDERIAGKELIATAVVNIRNYADDLLYSDAMKEDTKELEVSFDIPRVHLSGKAMNDFQQWVKNSPDMFDEVYYKKSQQIARVVDPDMSAQYNDMQEELKSVRQNFMSKPMNRRTVEFSRNGSLTNFAGYPTGSLYHEQDLYDRVFADPAEGHYELPQQLTEEVDEINIVYEDNLRDIIVTRGIQLEEDASDPYAGNGTLTWPQEDEETREANMQTHLLETSEALQPFPFHTVRLFRGSQLESLDARKVVGFFKASVLVRPDVPEFEHAYVVKEDYKVYDQTPRSNSRGESLQPLGVQSGQIVIMEEDLDRIFVAVRLVTFRPDKPLETGTLSFLPRRVLAPLPDPFAAVRTSRFDTSTSGPALIDIRIKNDDDDSNLVTSSKAANTSNSMTDGASNNKTSDPRNNRANDNSGDNNYQDENNSPKGGTGPSTLKIRGGAYASIADTMHHPQDVKVRVYIVACANLPSQALFSSSSDPYLIVQLNVPQYLKDKYPGATYHNGRAEYKSDTLDPYFGAWVELDARFPDVHEVEIQVWNANYLSDDMIGKTVIDLEDRWFNPAWHELKFQRKRLKEFRPLHSPSSKLVQGVCECWIEMFTPGEAGNTAIVDIRQPKIEPWELRLVIWETRRVPLLDDHTYANLLVTGELTFTDIDGRSYQKEYTTDTHTGLKDGKGIFNYRMLYPFQAPAKFMRLHLKVWERYGFSYTALGEANLDLSSLMREAVRTQQQVVDRPRSWVALSHSNWPGESRGDLDIQMSLVREKYALQHPVGNARDAPNENPFLPDPPRESFFSQVFRSTGYGRVICCTICILLILFIIFFVVFSPW